MSQFIVSFVVGFGFMVVCFILVFLTGCFLKFVGDLMWNTKPIYGILLCCVVMGLIFVFFKAILNFII